MRRDNSGAYVIVTLENDVVMNAKVAKAAKCTHYL